MQQYLPFTVLKLYSLMTSHTDFFNVATVLTVYGIETFQKPVFQFIAWELQQYLPFTVLKPYRSATRLIAVLIVATVLTVYGIETHYFSPFKYSLPILLQQYLPFTVLKRVSHSAFASIMSSLQQYLPFTVLKHATVKFDNIASR